MSALIVVSDPSDWPPNMPGVEVVSGRNYLTDAALSARRHTRVFNLSRSYRYQTTGYYVSLLASARGHRPLPSVTTIQDMRSLTIVRSVTDDLDELVQHCLGPIQSDHFVLSVYFGHNMAQRYTRLALQLFNLFPAPMLRAHFVRDDRWRLVHIKPIPASDVPDSHWPFLIDVATRHFAGHTRSVARPKPAQYDLAILHDPKATDCPSNDKALKKFIRAAEQVGFDATLVTKDDYGRIAEFDALFIRETTAVNHHTFRFSRRAAAEGLVVIDDPESIVRCTNKVYLAEALLRHDIPSPRTLIVHRGNVDQIVPTLGLPCVLKQPDSSFSHGVVKVHTEEELNRRVEELLEKSDLLVAQEFLPTEFDWRIGVFNGQPLWACRYHMAAKHWQIVKHSRDGSRSYGKVDTCPVAEAPKAIARAAVRACRLMGNGLYGVDLKIIGRKGVVIEVNDNPNIDAGYEDQVLKDDLYLRIMEGFLERVRARTEGKTRT